MSTLSEANCEIVIAGTISEAWSAWFGGFGIVAQGARTRLVGNVVDQAALHGVLGGLRDLGIPILQVHVTPSSTGEAGVRANTPGRTRRDGPEPIPSNQSFTGGEKR